MRSLVPTSAARMLVWLPARLPPPSTARVASASSARLSTSCIDRATAPATADKSSAANLGIDLSLIHI